MAPADPIVDRWPMWVRALAVLGAALLTIGGVIGAFAAKQPGALVLGLVAAGVGLFLLAQTLDAADDPA